MQRSEADERHRIAFSALGRLRFGIDVSTLAIVASPRPFLVTTSDDVNANGNEFDDWPGGRADTRRQRLEALVSRGGRATLEIASSGARADQRERRHLQRVQHGESRRVPAERGSAGLRRTDGRLCPASGADRLALLVLISRRSSSKASLEGEFHAGCREETAPAAFVSPARRSYLSRGTTKPSVIVL